MRMEIALSKLNRDRARTFSDRTVEFATFEKLYLKLHPFAIARKDNSALRIVASGLENGARAKMHAQ